MKAAVAAGFNAGAAWSLAEEAEHRFRRWCLRIGIPVLLLGVILPWLKLELLTPEAEIPEPVRYAQLLPQQAAAPAASVPAPMRTASAPIAKAPAEASRPAPTRKTAQEIARQSGLMQLTGQLAQMRSMNVTAADSRRALTAGSPSGENTTGASGAELAAAAAESSGGVGQAGQGRVAESSGSGFDSRQTGAVQGSGPAGSGTAADSGNGNGPRRSRTLEEIQLTFDRSKAAFFSIFNRAARETSGISAGRIIVNLTIAPDGSVIGCDLVSSSFSNQTLEQKVLQRVRMLNFGPKDVPVFNFPNYPINFIAS